ncbi:MAG: RHS repeat-associated core domain-containing protein [Lachnospira sp.]|nr:RHS repeat-associated core domain-containing protein [Lachnospira sp.]
MSLSRSGVNASFTYDIDGYRTSKTVNGVTTTYYVDGGTITALKKGTDELMFFYDEKGLVVGFYYNGVPYVYVKNLQGDVIGIIDKSCKWVVSYSYDAWGSLLEIDGELADTLGTLNPFRYRGYVYDDETGLYYLNSRYYEPNVGRFLNADGYASTGQSVQSCNMFAYCQNNPVVRYDPTGCSFEELLEFLATVVSYASNNVSSLRPAYAGCGGIAAADGPLPIGDTLATIGAVAITVGAVGFSVIQATKEKEEKSIPIIDSKAEEATKKKEPVIFPLNPYEFNPIGLTRTEYVPIGQGKNGGIIKWEIPGTKVGIFEWNEDYKYGAHYHAMLPSWGNRHGLMHYAPGMFVPEPWRSLYFE